MGKIDLALSVFYMVVLWISFGNDAILGLCLVSGIICFPAAIVAWTLYRERLASIILATASIVTILGITVVNHVGN